MTTTTSEERTTRIESWGLTEHQRTIGERIVTEESAKREHLVVYLSGAHAYGFPSPDSDLDLKTIHIARTAALLGFDPPLPTFDRAEVVEGVEIDYTSNEIAHVLSGILNGNGNFLERILGSTAWTQLEQEMHDLRPLVRGVLSRRVHRHYRGFATNQLKALEREPTVKKLLYVLRTALTGTHLLRTGELETNILPLADAYELRDIQELVKAKRAGERVAADSKLLADWAPRVNETLGRLDTARDRSVLPEEPRNVAALEAWLTNVRRQRF